IPPLRGVAALRRLLGPRQRVSPVRVRLRHVVAAARRRRRHRDRLARVRQCPGTLGPDPGDLIMHTDARDSRLQFTPQLMMGLLIIIVGVVFTLDNLGIEGTERFIRYWPVGLIAIGMVKLWQSRGSAFGGLVFLTAGTWLLLESLRIVHVHFWDM